MELVLKVVGTLIIVFAMLFLILPGGFGLHNFKSKNGLILSLLASSFYYFLWGLHVFILYNIWFLQQHVLISCIVLLVLFIGYFLSVARDVGTSGGRGS